MTYPFEENDEVIVTEDIETISFTKEECAALLKECRYSYISYENPLARGFIRKMVEFVDGT